MKDSTFFNGLPSHLALATLSVVFLLISSAETMGIPTADESDQSSSSSYGVDVSFPVFHSVSTNYPGTTPEYDDDATVNQPLQRLGNRHEIYLDHIEGCREWYEDEAEWCDRYEYNRMLMNLRQPSSMVNYTKRGFQKIQAPESLTKVISKFWKSNHYKGTEEIWPPANSYNNHWDSPTYMISVEDSGLRGSGPELKSQIWRASAAILEEWTQQELQPCSLYGIRVYGEGSIMMPHVDRLPLVASAIIAVAQDLEEPWPFEMYDHDGVAHNITIQPGEMLLFESHSVIHGHPFPLKGEFAAYIFIHFEPTGTALHQDSTGVYRKGASLDDHYKASIKNGVAGPSASEDALDLPPYIQHHSAEEQNWIQEHPKGWNPPEKILPSSAHVAAKTGNLEELVQELEDSTTEDGENVLTQRDENGWQVLHQGVASGNKEVVELLIKKGASLNSRTHGGYGETPLRIAEKWHGKDHPIVNYLKGLGALSLGPEL